jgi:hypothetical protein
LRKISTIKAIAPQNIRRSNKRNKILGFDLGAEAVGAVTFLPFFLLGLAAAASSGLSLG